MKKLSEQLLEISQRTAAWENRSAALQAEDRKQVEADTAEARAAVQKAQTQFEAKLNNIQASMYPKWREVQESFNKQVAAAQSRAEEWKATQDLADAREAADFEQTYAEVAAEFAHLAAAEANEATLKAIQARAHAKSLE